MGQIEKSTVNIRPLALKDKEDVFRLFSFLRTGEPIPFEAELFVNDPHWHCLILENENGLAIGFAALHVHNTPSKGRISRIEDVVVDGAFQGRGYGKLLMEKLLEIAKKEKVNYIELTSKKIRTAARKFYESYGFQVRESDIYRLNL